MEQNLDDLISVADAAKRAGVARNTMLLAAKNGTIRAKRLGRSWFVYAGDIGRWKTEHYRPNKAHRFPVKNVDADTDDHS